jgi:DNA-binding winged helix-turn-helix (wHTH) protein
MQNRVRFGHFEADLESYELFREGQRISIQRQPFRLLAILIEHAGQVVTREVLRRKLWPNGVIVDFEHSLNTAVRKIRRALGDSPEEPHIVETVAGRGYRLRMPVEPCESAPSWPVRAPRAANGASHQNGEALAATLRAIALSLGAELSGDPEGPVATTVAALFVGSEDAFRSAQELRRRANGSR